MTTPRFALEQFLIRHKLLAALEGVRLREIGNMVNETVRHDVGLILLLRLKHLVSSQIIGRRVPMRAVCASERASTTN